MDNVPNIYWYQGLFLQPHHLQRMEQANKANLRPFMAYSEPHLWGVNQLVIDASSIKDHRFEVARGDFLFPDGTCVSFPGSALLKSRSFKKVFADNPQPFKVYVGLRKWNPGGENVTVIDPTTDLATVRTRFVSDVNPKEVKDLHTGGGTAQLRLMDHLLGLYWESELPGLGDYLLIPVAQLEQERGDPRLSERFAAPALTLDGAEALLQSVRSIRDQLGAHARHLEEYKLAPDLQSAEFRATYSHYLLALCVLGRHLPLLSHLLDAPTVHPWKVFGHLRQLAGELSTFTHRVDILGRLSDGRKLLPDYVHADALPCFHEADQLIGELLNAIIVGPQKIIDLVKDGPHFRAPMPVEVFDARNAFYLTLRTAGGDPERIQDELCRIAKVSTREQTATLLARSLSGVPLEWSPSPPPGLPKYPGAFYLKIDHTHAYWADIQRSLNFCLYWDGAPEDTKAEIVVLRR